MDRENSIAVSEKEGINIKCVMKLTYFFCCRMKRKMERKAFRCKKDKIYLKIVKNIVQ